MKKIHLPGLNGLRALAALAVVFSHINMGMRDYGLPPRPTIDLASYGVLLFFTLSGFLISLLLFIEQKRFGHIEIRKFYWRRLLRIWPLYYLYLALAVATTYIWGSSPEPQTFLLTLFLLPNIAAALGNALLLTGHYWSLGAEEQFYLFWPWLLQKSKSHTRSITGFLLVMLAIKVTARVVDAKFGIALPFALVSNMPFSSMAIGALGACLYFHTITEPSSATWPAKMLRLACSRSAQVACWGLVLLTAFNKFHFVSLFDGDIFSVASAILILNSVANPRPLLNMEWRPLDFLGRISFGIYVYNGLMNPLMARVIGPLQMPLVAKTMLVYTLIPTLTVLIAYLSYRFYESPFIRLKEKFSKVHSSNAVSDSLAPEHTVLQAKAKADSAALSQ
jgi:peptidoglycan/LPS O-acetylase OafA/YrhL